MSGNFYRPEEIRPLYGEVVQAYQTAFAGEPWFEVSKCVDRFQRCVGGLSSVAVGAMCGTCNISPTRPAYEADELLERFEQLAATRPAEWYAERDDEGFSPFALAWLATPDVIAREKYKDVPAMGRWLEQTLGNDKIVWLDEVFANLLIRPNGNLKNFGAMCEGFVERLGATKLAFRTISGRMISAAERLKDRATVFQRSTDVPDRRDFVLIEGSER